MTSVLEASKEKSKKRRELLAEQMGLRKESDLGIVLGNNIAAKEAEETAVKKFKTTGAANEQKQEDKDSILLGYTDSKLFLKGNKNNNPHNDYCQNFVDTQQRPQNYVRDAGLTNRFEEYPKLRELIRLKDELVATTATPPMYQHADLTTYSLTNLKNQFDVILIEPPLHEYQTSNGIVYDKYWSWDEISQLEIDKITAHRAFLWMWCGCEGLDAARQCLKRWGFRRCEDICWIKTNLKNPGQIKSNMAAQQIFQRTKEHCLMGIKGTVRRSTDGDFIHANVDMDLIIDEEPPYGSKEKPKEMFHIIEHFCLGRRRLHLFGRDDTIRPGWLTVGPEVTTSNFDADMYRNHFSKPPGTTTSCTDEIERLRPKSPPPKSQQMAADDGQSQGDPSQQGGSLNRGRGGTRGMVGRGGPHMNGPFPRGRGNFRGGYQPPDY